jgi:hypothetical protein
VVGSSCCEDITSFRLLSTNDFFLDKPIAAEEGFDSTLLSVSIKVSELSNCRGDDLMISSALLFGEVSESNSLFSAFVGGSETSPSSSELKSCIKIYTSKTLDLKINTGDRLLVDSDHTKKNKRQKTNEKEKEKRKKKKDETKRSNACCTCF